MASRIVAFLGLVASAAAECPNACSGHGEMRAGNPFGCSAWGHHDAHVLI